MCRQPRADLLHKPSMVDSVLLHCELAAQLCVPLKAVLPG